MANLPPVIKQRYFDSNGNPLAGGKLYTYQAGTTTPQATYTDQGEGTPNANPIILDASGECSMWLDPDLSYKFVLKDSNDNTQWTVDNVVGLLSTGSVVTASIQDDAVTQAKIADDAVGADQLKDSAAVDADRAVTTDHIRNSAVTAAKLNSDVVDNSTLQYSTNLRIKDGGVTRAKLASLGQQVSTSSGSASTTSTSWADVTNLSVSITTTGRPVFLALISGSTESAPNVNTAGSIEASDSAAQAAGFLGFLRDSTLLAVHLVRITATGATAAFSSVPASVLHVDTPIAGTYTYKVQAKVDSAGDTLEINNVKLVAFEL
jgi:hypothetical protein